MLGLQDVFGGGLVGPSQGWWHFQAVPDGATVRDRRNSTTAFFTGQQADPRAAGAWCGTCVQGPWVQGVFKWSLKKGDQLSDPITLVRATVLF